MSSLMVRLSFFAMDWARFSISGGRVTERVLVLRMGIVRRKDFGGLSVLRLKAKVKTVLVASPVPHPLAPNPKEWAPNLTSEGAARTGSKLACVFVGYFSQAL